MSRNLVKRNSILNVIKLASTILFPLITFPYVSRTLLVDAVGKVNFGNSVVSYFSLFASLGISTYAVKECAQNRNDRNSLSKTASEIFSINLFATILSYFILAVFLVFARPLREYRLLITIQSTVILFNTLGTEWVNSAMEDYVYMTVRTLAFQVVSVVLILAFVRYPQDYLKYAAICVISTSGSSIANVIYRKKYCDVYLTFDMQLKKHLPSIFVFFSMILAQQIYVNSDITILGLCKGDFEVGLYSTSVKIYNIINMVVSSISIVVLPQIAEAYVNKNQIDINRLAKYSLSFIVVLGIPCIVGINMITEEIILLIAGEEYIGATMSLHILTAALLISFFGGWLGNVMFLPTNRAKVCLIASTAAALVNIILNLIFIPVWGLNAAATTTVIAEGVALLTLILHYDNKMKIDGLIDVLKGPILGSVFIVFSAVLIRIIFDNPICICILTIVVSAIGYLSILVIVKNEFLMEYVGTIKNSIRDVYKKL